MITWLWQVTVPALCERVMELQIPRQQALDSWYWAEEILEPIWPTLPVDIQLGQVPPISYKLLLCKEVESHWGLGDLNDLQWWHSSVQQKYHSRLPGWKRAFSLVRKWQRIASREVPIAGLQANLISLTLTHTPGPKPTTADENNETSLWSVSKSD